MGVAEACGEFALSTLAFAQAGSILVMQNPFGLTGGEEGLALGGGVLPASLIGVANTRNLYWIALVLLLVVYVIAWLAVNSPAGRVWQAIRKFATPPRDVMKEKE